MKCLSVSICLAVATTAPTFAAELPKEFIGVWSLASDAQNQCKRGDWENDRNDGMISVTKNTIDYWESSCKIASTRKLDESTFESGLACGGEGQKWRSKEVWYVVKVGLRRQLVAVSLDRFDERDDAGKKLKNPDKHKVNVGVYLECK